MLAEKEPGTFLIRLSSSVSGAFTFSAKGPDRTITSCRVEKTDDSFRLKMNGADYTGETLEALVGSLRDENPNFTACFGSPLVPNQEMYSHCVNN